MTVALVTTSHSPLMGRNQPADEVVAAVEASLDRVRAFVADYDPELVVIFGPDHYNGFFYDMMPPFCVGVGAEGIGDYDTSSGPMDVDRDVGYAIAKEALAREIDVAYSEQMKVDHGIAQPLDLIFGGFNRTVVPIFINCVATPLGPAKRARLLGEAVGDVIGRLDRRVLVMGSGGLSHDPPVPKLEASPPEVREKLISGRNPSSEEREARESRTAAVGRAFGKDEADIQPLNPAWDRDFMRLLAENRLTEVDSWSNEWFAERAGNSSHEVRTWLAAYAALGVNGPYETEESFYHPIPEWIAGFGITTARLAG